MIDKCMDILKNQIHQYFKSIPDLNVTSNETVSVSPLVKEDGSIVIPKDHLGLTLINIEEEKIHKAQTAVHKTVDGQIMHMNPELKINLYILLASNFNTYATGLKFLSACISFFQSKNVFTAANTPDFEPKIDKIIVELHTMGLEQQNHLWGYLGAKYLPSICYKVRMLIVQEGLAQDQQPGISETSFEGMGITAEVNES
ncbi:DUF4255 domain-containing protein [Aliikangiella coralliicola]|uniref:DUF4255 domain-containing protein n=1 Tax=Aliikangiella coralliicola TaxID=2592383 RepID=A0A545UDA3_9GAMM|nr:DUF4255 domain-containing protein [Aliikangiella coralliicola]TQV87440.1 DUF4255 domain-containing protein [Aliikangiella coralliicola]